MTVTVFWKWVKWIAGGFFLLIAALLLAGYILSEARPKRAPSPEADALANKMLVAINHDSWIKTGAVKWTFRGQNHHIWDKHQHVARVKWSENEVFLNLSNKTGAARVKGEKTNGEKLENLLESAWLRWINDSFWLNPVSRIFDEGTVRSVVTLENGEKGLLVEYTTGGATPGDAYLWLLDETGLPKAWKMWTSNIPIGGLEASWENWITLATGVKIATKHKILFFEFELTNIQGAENVESLENGDITFASRQDAR